MSRLNMVLDSDTSLRLIRRAKLEGVQRAKLARRILAEGLKREEDEERARALALDYAKQKTDDTAEVFAPGQLELMGHEED